MNLNNKVAFITGGTRMGLAIGQALQSHGYQIILTWRHSKAAIEQTVQSLKAYGAEASALRCDTSSESSIAGCVRKIQRKFGRLDLLVNMASIFDLGPLTGKNGIQLWKKHMAVHAESTLYLSRACAPLMKRSKGANMVHISDWTPASGRPRYKDYGGYYVSKAAVKALVEVLALELAPEIRVNAIAPGPMLPPSSMSAKEQKAVKDATPLRRWGGPEEIAKTVLFLTQSDFVTGETIRVDGGRHLN